MRSQGKFIFIRKKPTALPEDWCPLISEDFDKMGVNISNEKIAQMQKVYYYKLLIDDDVIHL